jgi:NitT/TauT family transport system substrate-binding protein
LNYQNAIQATTATVDNKPGAIKAFLAASAEGWKQCVSGDYAAAEEAVLKASPDQNKPLFEYSMKQLIDRKIVAGEEGLPLGAMTDARWKAFFTSMAAVGVVPKTLDYKAAYTLKFQ